MTKRAIFFLGIWLFGAVVWSCTGGVDGGGGAAVTTATGSPVGSDATQQGTSTGAGTTRAASGSGPGAGTGGAPAEEVKVAFIGDTGAGDAFESVLALVLAEGGRRRRSQRRLRLRSRS